MSNEETPPILAVTDAPGSEAEEVIEGGLAQFNEDNAGYRIRADWLCWSPIPTPKWWSADC